MTQKQQDIQENIWEKLKNLPKVLAEWLPPPTPAQWECSGQSCQWPMGQECISNWFPIVFKSSAVMLQSVQVWGTWKRANETYW